MKEKMQRWTNLILKVLGVFFILVVIVAILAPPDEEDGVGTQNSSSDTSQAQIQAEELEQDYIGKTACNSSNDVCAGVVMNKKPCATDSSQECYVIYLGEDYSRPVERPVANTYLQ